MSSAPESGKFPDSSDRNFLKVDSGFRDRKWGFHKALEAKAESESRRNTLTRSKTTECEPTESRKLVKFASDDRGSRATLRKQEGEDHGTGFFVEPNPKQDVGKEMMSAKLFSQQQNLMKPKQMLSKRRSCSAERVDDCGDPEEDGDIPDNLNVILRHGCSTECIKAQRARMQQLFDMDI